MSDFHLLLEEQIPQLMRYATALLRDAETAGELVEDTVREALAHPRRYADDTRLRLLATLHDLRDNPFRRMMCDQPAPHASRAPLTLSDLDRALGRLSEDDRAVILLIGLEDLSYAAAATVLRIPVPRLRARLARARDALRELMGVTGTPRVTTPRRLHLIRWAGGRPARSRPAAFRPTVNRETGCG